LPAPFDSPGRTTSCSFTRTRSPEAFAFYHTEALRGGWSVRQLDRQIASQFYERIALSRNKNAMLRKGTVASAEDSVSADEEVRDPLILSSRFCSKQFPLNQRYERRYWRRVAE
jgi:predicted nuclease of restriction endonuclease-like (RecB) superfamily